MAAQINVPSAVCYKIVGLDNDKIKENAKEGFLGWHYLTPDPVPRTAFAAVAGEGLKEFKKEILDKKKETVIQINKDKDWKSKYAGLLFNKGQALQTRAENMLLARSTRILVRGGSDPASATPCNVEGYATLTNAHRLAFNQSVQFLITEAERSLGSADFNVDDSIWSRMRNLSTGGLSDKALKLRQEKTMDSLIELRVHPELMAHLVQATANILTAYSDAGTRFRDRQARVEAIRHQTQTARAILAYTILDEEFKKLFQGND